MRKKSALFKRQHGRWCFFIASIRFSGPPIYSSTMELKPIDMAVVAFVAASSDAAPIFLIELDEEFHIGGRANLARRRSREPEIES